MAWRSTVSKLLKQYFGLADKIGYNSQTIQEDAYMLSDYPNSLKALKAIQPQIESLDLGHRGAIAAINQVRANHQLPELSVHDLILATIPRLEDKINAQVSEARSESQDEQEVTTGITEAAEED